MTTEPALSNETLTKMREFWERRIPRADPAFDVDAVPRALMATLERDPSASKALSDATAVAKSRPLKQPRTFNQIRAGVEFYSGGSPVIRSAPYSYGVHHGNLVSVSEDNNAGKMFLNGLAGLIMSSPGNYAMGVSTLGLVVNASDLGALPGLGVAVRVGASVNWAAAWDLEVTGIPAYGVGSDPWSQARGGLNLTVWGPAGFVTQNGETDVFSQHFSDHPGGHVSPVHNADNGFIPLSATFWVPPNEPRYVNVDSYVEVKVGFTEPFNESNASALMQNTLNFMVLTAQ